MSDYEFDLITLGAGSGGVRASRLAGSYGAKVAIIEASRLGGTCVIRGCVPKKLLVYASTVAEEIEDAKGYGWTIGDVSFDWAHLIEAKNRELDRLEAIYGKLLSNANVEIVGGRATLIDAHTVQVGDRVMTSKRILIATGGHPALPNIPGIEHAITSAEALDLPALPEEIVILGGGYIAVEFAGVFNALGVKTTIVIRADQVLRGFDADVRSHLTTEMERKGIHIRAGVQVEELKKGDDGRITVMLADGDHLVASHVLAATGRLPNTRGLNLDGVGVEIDPQTGAIKVDEWSQTSVPSIWAVGDVTNRVNLTPVAIGEGRAFAETEFNNNPIRMDHHAVPAAVFSHPTIGTVGLSEAEARAQGPVDIYKANFRPLKNTISGRQDRTLMKLVVRRSDKVVVGAHMVGPDAPEIIQGLAIAVKVGLTKTQFDATVAIHPTSAEEFVTMRTPEPEPEARVLAAAK